MTRDNIIDLQGRVLDRMAATGEFSYAHCSICRDTRVGLVPVVGIAGAERRQFIVALMCISPKCRGDTYFIVENGIVSEEAMILKD